MYTCIQDFFDGMPDFFVDTPGFPGTPDLIAMSSRRRAPKAAA
jgi:hypothetical protein